MKFLNIEITFLRGAAMLAVFGVSLAIPIIIYGCLREATNNLLIKQNLEVIKNWAAIERFKKGSYEGLESSADIKNNAEEIKKIGGEIEVYVSKDNESYCAKSHFGVIEKNKAWCIDSTGYSGKDSKSCSKETTHCQ
jgi:hypothetical protein